MTDCKWPNEFEGVEWLEEPEVHGKNPEYLNQIRQLPCVICDAFGQTQTTRTEAHHTICGRFGTSKTPDCMAIPLCDCHHQAKYGGSNGKLAIHKGKESWVTAYGEDTEYIHVTQDKVGVLP